MHQNIAYLYAFFGLFLITCGVVSVLFLGRKAKTAIMSGGFFGLVALTAGHFLNLSQPWALYLGLTEAFLLTFIFAWRASTAFHTLMELVQANDQAAVRSKSIAFLIIATMFIMALFVLAVSVTFLRQVLEGLG
ncbi:hypothetical protein [Botryobacter ruber]|uniref:hypothetical protein n=1 Tax=Botryobacter ruber TaxID=2171629 RepID=UPI000E0C5D74|nr:hypothetical protein [Botryobacter ruber]